MPLARDEEDRVARPLGQRLDGRHAQRAQVGLAALRQRTQQLDPCAGAVQARVRVLLHEPVPDEGREQAVRGRLGQAQRVADLGQAQAGGGAGQQPQRGHRPVERLQAHVAAAWRRSSRRLTLLVLDVPV
jgi:hypothetical protein